MSELRESVIELSVDLIRKRNSMFGRTIAYHIEPLSDRVRSATLEVVDRQAAMQAQIDALREQVETLAEALAQLSVQVTGKRAAVRPPAFDHAPLVDELIRLTDLVSNLQSVVRQAAAS